MKDKIDLSIFLDRLKAACAIFDEKLSPIYMSGKFKQLMLGGKLTDEKIKSWLREYMDDPQDVYKKSDGVLECSIEQRGKNLYVTIELSNPVEEELPGIDEFHDNVRILSQRVMDLEKHFEEHNPEMLLSHLGRIISSISHEIVNPINSSLISLQLLEDEEGEKRNLSIIRANLLEIKDIIDEYRIFSRSEVAFESIEPVAVYEMLIEKIGKRLEVKKLKLELTELSSRIRTDSFRLLQLLKILIINSIEASPEGEPIELIFDEDESYYRIYIEDSGGGIEEKTLEKVFDFFYTTKDYGTGIGLSLAKRIVEKIGGSIRLYNNDKGLTAEILLGKEQE